MLATARRVLGYDLLELCLQGPKDKLDNTVYSQVGCVGWGCGGTGAVGGAVGRVVGWDVGCPRAACPIQHCPTNL